MTSIGKTHRKRYHGVLHNGRVGFRTVCSVLLPVKHLNGHCLSHDPEDDFGLPPVLLMLYDSLVACEPKKNLILSITCCKEAQ